MKNIVPLYARERLAIVTRSIVSAISPEKVFLLSVIYREEKPQNIFVTANAPAYTISAVHLLVLAAESDSRSNDALQDIIEHRTMQNTDITATVFAVHQFNSWLMKGHPFASRVYQHAIVLYDSGAVPLAIPNQYDEAEAKKVLHEVLNVHVTQAAEFISGAELFMLRKRYALAAFHLHQAAEQLYSGIIWLVTGLRVHTHNLDKLYRYSKHLLPGIHTVFPRDSGPEKELFRWLQKAYVDGRYNHAFSVKYLIISQLSDRVKKLLELCKTLPPSITHT